MGIKIIGNKKKAVLISYSVVFIALITAASWVSLPIPPVPFTLQTLAILVCATVMKRYAVIPVTLYVILGCLNLPVFHNGALGIGVLLGPTGGFLVGFIPAALVCGYLCEFSKDYVHLAGLILATIIIYIFGIYWLMYSTGMALEAAILAGCAPFLFGDSIKLILAYHISKKVKKIEIDAFYD